MVVTGDAVRRARPGDGAALALVGALTRPGAVYGFTVTGWHHRPVDTERAIDVDQSNESVVVSGPDGGAVVKWVVRSGDGHDPAPDRVSRLVDARFDAMPRPWGLVQWQGEGRAELVAMVTELVPGARDGWEWAVEDARAYAAGSAGLAPTATEPARALGEVVARMHLGLADDVPPRADVARATAWRDDALAGLAEARALMDGAEGERLERHADTVRATLASLGGAADTPLVPIHGDLHVGQVLRGDDGAYRVTDFDGNPVVPGPERTALQPAATDVAGIVQSLDHVAYVVLHRTPGVDVAAVERWRQEATTTFLAAYRRTLAAAGRAALLDESLLEPLRLRQVCREYVYAGRHLPHWRYVPDRALRARYEVETDR